MKLVVFAQPGFARCCFTVALESFLEFVVVKIHHGVYEEIATDTDPPELRNLRDGATLNFHQLLNTSASNSFASKQKECQITEAPYYIKVLNQLCTNELLWNVWEISSSKKSVVNCFRRLQQYLKEIKKKKDKRCCR